MFALAINSNRYRYRSRELWREESHNDTLRKGPSHWRRRPRLSHRRHERRQALCLLCSASLPAGMSGKRFWWSHEIVEECQVESRIMPIVVKKSGKAPSARRCRRGESALLEVLQTLRTLDRQTDLLQAQLRRSAGSSSPHPLAPACRSYNMYCHTVYVNTI